MERDFLKQQRTVGFFLQKILFKSWELRPWAPYLHNCYLELLLGAPRLWHLLNYYVSHRHTCVHMCTHVRAHTHMCTRTHNLLSPFCFAHVCVCSGLNNWHWISYMGAFPWRKLIFSQSYQSHCFSSHWSPIAPHRGWNPTEFSQSILSGHLVLTSCWSCSRSHIVEISWVHFPYRAWGALCGHRLESWTPDSCDLSMSSVFSPVPEM